MDIIKWFEDKAPLSKKRINNKMNNELGEQSERTLGRPSSFTYGNALDAGYKSLKEEVNLLMCEIFEESNYIKEAK